MNDLTKNDLEVIAASLRELEEAVGLSGEQEELLARLEDSGF